MPTKRFENLDENRKNAILDAAEHEFILHGYEVASLNAIIEAADISKGSLYYYFEDKEDLYLAVITRAMMALNSDEVHFPTEFTEDFWDQQARFAMQTLRHARNNPGLFKLFRGYTHLASLENKSEQFQSFYNEWKAQFEALLREGYEKGLVRDDMPLDMLAEILYSIGEVGDVWLFEHWDEYTEEETQDIIESYVGILRSIAEGGYNLNSKGGTE